MAARRLAALVLFASLAGGVSAAAQPADAEARGVQQVVERFLADLGGHRLDALPPYFAPKANIIVVRQRDGAWAATSQTADEWLAQLRRQPSATRFEEPLSGVSVQVDSGHLAYVRADFTVVVDGKVVSHGVDYFTLASDGDTWKFVSVAYTSLPGAPR